MRQTVQASVSCADLDAAIAAYEQFGLRLDMIMPADAPRLALMSAAGVALRLELGGAQAPAIDRASPAFAITRAGDAWGVGRAGMQYRDLIPGRLGGQVIASHIRIPGGGPVPDYVHYHHVRFQMIYCAKGWVRVVYEDQGPPFVMNEGDCVLQPPGIRHRVLESSPGLEVIEVSAPAEHETYRDHGLALPTPSVRTDRSYGGQTFVRHVASSAEWHPAGRGFAVRDTGIAKASGQVGSVRVLRSGGGRLALQPPASGVVCLIVLSGDARLRGEEGGSHRLTVGDACLIPFDDVFELEATSPCEILDVALVLDD